jgi:CBS domain containing-hemolysin-like protein
MAKTKKNPRRSASVWVISVFFLSFALSMLMSWSSSVALASVGIAVATLTVLLLVAIGILFDVLGVAVTSAEMPPLVSMASKKVPGAKQALWMLKNADRVSSVCNDVVGDICGVVSGSAGATLAIRIVELTQHATVFAVGIWVSAFIAALTVGGKAFGKRIAISKSRDILMLAGRIAAFFGGRSPRK